MTHLFFNEDVFYKLYTGHTRAVLIEDEVIRTHNTKEFDEAILHCRYNDGRVDGGRYLSPIFRTIVQIQNHLPGLEAGYSLLHIK